MNIAQRLLSDIENSAATAAERYVIPPWLAKAVTSEAVRDVLQKQVPEFSSGQIAIVDCELKRMRWRTSELCWSGMCLLTLERSTGSGTDAVALHSRLIPPELHEDGAKSENHPFESEQWRCYFPELRLELSKAKQSARLAALPQLTEPEAARRLLEESLRTSRNSIDHNFRIKSCEPQIMRYKPGSRCTILYRLQYPKGTQTINALPEVVIAKTHRGDKGRIAYEGMQALWQSPLRTSSTVTIAEPLAYLPESRVLIQGPIREEMTLKDFVRQTLLKSDGQTTSESLNHLQAYLRKTAAGLAELHACGVHRGEIVTWEDELADFYKSRASLTSVLPKLEDFASGLLESLQQLAASHPADALAPAHRSFRPAQVLLDRGNIGFIDFDGFCQAEPAMDVALFMTTIKNMLRIKIDEERHQSVEYRGVITTAKQLEKLIQADALCDYFLTEYEKHSSVSRIRIRLWETLQILSLFLGSWKKLKLERLQYCRLLLVRQINHMVNTIESHPDAQPSAPAGVNR